MCTKSINQIYNVSILVKSLLRGHKEKVALQDRWPLERGWIHMKMSMTGQEKDDILIQVTA